ncbi:energy-coupling factor transporter ATPase [Gemella sp. 19428wG2_WT2a]|nr:energy-coupling factor transporter ATPase [Gemella sp. 19428wG2_WT2a]TFU60187.1 energy-coupling factor transporter ATPase [Gemella sp. WT2a]
MLRFENVTFKYSNSKENTLENISFTLESGEWLTIIGSNGSGKSTITKLISANLLVDSGKIFLYDKAYEVENLNLIRDNVAIVFQNPDNQFVGASVEEDVAFGLENKKIPSQDMEEIIVDSLSKVDMLEYRKAEPRNLSGGQKQRVAIASALAMKPKLLILDEATSMLDPKSRKEILNYIKKINVEEKISVISITHDAEELAYSNNVLFIDKGKIFKKISADSMLENGKLLSDSCLELPFLDKLKVELNKKLNNDIFSINDDMEEVIDKLCKLVLKK